MSLADAVKSYGKIKHDLNKKGDGYMWSGAGKAMIGIGTALSKLDKAMATNRASHEDFQAGADALGIDSDALKGTTYDAPDETKSFFGKGDSQSFFSRFKEGVRENFTKAKNMDAEITKTFNGKDYTYDARKISGIGSALGTSKEALAMQATYKGEYTDKWKEQLIQDFGTQAESNEIVQQEDDLTKEDDPTKSDTSYNERGRYDAVKDYVEEEKINKNNNEEEVVDAVIEEDGNNILASDTKGFNDLNSDNQSFLIDSFKQHGRGGMKFEKGYSHSAFVEAQKIQGIMNKLGKNVGGSDAE